MRWTTYQTTATLEQMIRVVPDSKSDSGEEWRRMELPGPSKDIRELFRCKGRDGSVTQMFGGHCPPLSARQDMG